ncbi:MAG: TAXI family TRAP transporter solute-binding subunit, partial [Pseudomonadota bacterium]
MRLITQLIREIDEPGKIRVLPIVGYGQEENIRDLLHLRGVEFSVVNSDILAHLEQEGRLPKAKEKLRMVMPLIQKAVIVVASKDVGSIEALGGKSVATGGAGSQERITARTLFNVLGVAPTFTTGTGESVLTAVEQGASSAGVLLTHEPEELIRRIAENPDLKILDVPWSEKVGAVYDKAIISAVGAPQLQTVTLDTVLAIYNWQTSNSRFRNVSNFLRRAVSAVPDLIAGPPSLWNRID